MIDSSTLPSGVAFDNIEIYSNVMIVDLPATGKLRLEDAKYLGCIAEAMGLSGVSLSVGEFTTYISTEVYRQFRDGDLTWREYVARWGR